jgi:hypothetical protein
MPPWVHGFPVIAGGYLDVDWQRVAKKIIEK